MKGRNALIFNLLSFLLFVVLIFVGVKTRDVDKQIKRWHAEVQRRLERGVEDPVLRETVDKLEEDLKARISDSFELDYDPLDLARVIHTRKFLKDYRGELPEIEGAMRLSATVTSPDGNTAVVKYQGQSWIVTQGDIVGQKRLGDVYTVESVGVNSIVLRRPGEKLKLVTEKAPDTKAEEEKRFGPNGEKKPFIEVKQVGMGNS